MIGFMVVFAGEAGLPGVCSGFSTTLLALGIQPAVEPTSDAALHPELPVSVARIRSALDRPAPLRLTLPESHADFHIEIRVRPLYSPNLLGPVETLWTVPTGPVPPGGLHAFEQRQQLRETWSQPMFSVDLLSIGTAVHRAIANSRRAGAEKAARDDVQRALAEFCATHDCPQP
jgi:hypothetical protein